MDLTMTSAFRDIKPDEYRLQRTESEPPFGTFAPGTLQRALISLAKGSVLHRGIFRSTMTRLIMGWNGKPLDVMFRDCSYRLRGMNNLIEYGILLNPVYNRADIDFLIEGAPTGANFLDIGSNIGLYALPMAKAAGVTGKLVAIDANPLMAQTLLANAGFSLLDNVLMFACAVSDREGHADLKVRKDDIAIVQVDENPEGEIPVRTLKSIVDDAGLATIHGLKIDIEGHEDKALVPFMEAASQSLLPRRIVIEHPNPDEDYPGCAAVFAKRGYILMGRSRNNSFYALGA